MAIIAIRPERPADLVAIRDINERAFGGTAEARLVDLLRARGKIVASLVAECEGREIGC